MYSEAYEDWISIYDDKLETVWQDERAELRRVSMIYFAFQTELDKLKTDLNNEVKEIKFQLKQRDYLQKCKNFKGLAQSECFAKENMIPEDVPLKEIDLNQEKNEDFFIETPNTSAFFENCGSPPPAQKSTTTAISPVINKNRLNIYKRRDSGSASLLLHPVVTHKVDKTPKLCERVDEFKTPKSHDDSNVMDCSIIDNTPDLKQISKTKNSKFTRPQVKRRNKITQGSTLTQMFFEPKKKKKKIEIDSNLPSMGIDEMIDLINQSSGSETDDNLDVATDVKKDPEISSNFIENYDKAFERKKDSPDFVYNEVVRGKERKKLKGWSCQECENYYKNLNLPADELEKKMNQCSRHRHKFQPRDETYKGFWDLTFGPSPKTQDSEKSIVFGYRKS